MKKTLTAVFLILLLSFSGKDLTVKAPYEEWDKIYQKGQVVKKIIDNSTLPHNQVKFINGYVDSLNQMIETQIKQQLDSTKKK